MDSRRHGSKKARRLRPNGDGWKLAADTGSEDFVRRVAALNRRILSYNLKAPAASLQKLPFEHA